jgi:hypothetical protein
MTWQNILIKADKPEDEPEDEPDYNWIKDEFRKWGKQVRAKGPEIGESKNRSLYQFLANHVKQHRGRGGADINVYPILGRLGPMMKKDITKADYTSIISLIGLLERIEDSPKSNPANVYFSSPLRIVKGKRVGKQEWYGHWRSSFYAKWRKKLKKEFIPEPVESDWYSKTKFEAKPPVWQALYAEEGNNSSKVIVKKGLLPILKEYKKVVEG